MTRYNEYDPLYDNDHFMQNFITFVNNFESGKSLFYWVEEYLLQEKEFIQENGGKFRNV